jgi:hypothetical protein
MASSFARAESTCFSISAASSDSSFAICSNETKTWQCHASSKFGASSNPKRRLNTLHSSGVSAACASSRLQT